MPAYADKATRCVPLADTSHGVTLSLGFHPGPQRKLEKVFIDACLAFFEGEAGKAFIVG